LRISAAFASNCRDMMYRRATSVTFMPKALKARAAWKATRPAPAMTAFSPGWIFLPIFSASALSQREYIPSRLRSAQSGIKGWAPVASRSLS
jgi:hypothetical protein